MEKRTKMAGQYSARLLLRSNKLAAVNLRLARKKWGTLKPESVQNLKAYSQEFGFSIIAGDLTLLDNGWYVTHTGLIRLARRKHCTGIDVKSVGEFSLTTACRWAFRATVFKSAKCRGFVGYGDADPSNVSPLSAAPRCGWPRPEPSIGPCARPTASARSRKSARLSNGIRPPGSRRRSHPIPLLGRTETTEAPRFVTASAADPPAPARRQPGEVLRRRFLRYQDSPRSYPRTG
jgi:hypothetical protein